MLVATREGDRKCRLPPSRSALAALVYLRKNDTLRQLAAGFGIGRAPPMPRSTRS
ncbi:transposase family protein [Streptomyces vinaceus]